MTSDQIDLFKRAWRESSVKEVVAHIPYLVNLASDSRDIRGKSVARMRAEIERAYLLGVKYLVLHPGSAKSKGIERVVNNLNSIETKGVNVLLETMAGQGNSLGSRFEEIAEILSHLKDDSFGVCFDSAHVFQAGYDIVNDYQGVFDQFKKHIPIEKIKAFHLNDSKTGFGSRVDRHQHIGEGEIGLEFFRQLLNDERFKGIPKILETPETETRSEGNLKTLRNLIV